MPLDLNSPLQYVKGVGPARAKLLKRLQLHTIRDLLYYQPVRYEKRPEPCKIRDVKIDQNHVVCGKVVSTRSFKTSKTEFTQKGKRELSIIEAQVTDGTGWLRVVWFNQPYLKDRITNNTRLLLTGQVKRTHLSLIPQMTNPTFEVLEEDEGLEDLNDTDTALPIYGLTEGLTQRTLRTIIINALQSCDWNTLIDPIPDEILRSHCLPSLKEALYGIHFPPADASIDDLNRGVTKFQKRLAFEEILILQIGLCILKHLTASEPGISMKGTGLLRTQLMNNLPFKLTSAQERVVAEILNDMASPHPMSRLLQGDVGCGKTVVALIAILNAVECGYQTALMAPTEILAEQHYQNIKSLLGGIDVTVRLFTSSKREKGLSRISKNDAMIAVGTHALIQETISFEALGLAVIDEQHRFGVLQRASLREKGKNPDVLIMSATPIPRTLAMTLYGDLDYSVIDELPPGRTPVVTKLFTRHNKKEIYGILKRELAKGRQAYIVYPLIEESEKADLRSAQIGAQRLPDMLPGVTVGLIHGKMPQSERERVMREFKEGKIQVLVATTVIEVGVDVPNATVMVIVNAERFGLAQLHQLRGRVGRGSAESYCLLLCYNQTEEAVKRMQAMLKTTDGFKIAEEDMKIRGYGDLFGTRQSGMPELKTANLLRDGLLFETARSDAELLLRRDPDLKSYPALRSAVQQFWGDKIEIFKTA